MLSVSLNKTFLSLLPKNRKAPVIDNIIHEYIKSSEDLMIPVYLKLFNMLENHIKRMVSRRYKSLFLNKGKRSIPENYIPISLLCYRSKLFTTILNSH